MKIQIREVNLRVAEHGHRYQAIRVQVSGLDGRRFWKDAWIPLDRDRDSYLPGRYEFADRSFYVNRLQGISFYPRLEFVADLEDDSGPGDPLPPVRASVDPGAAAASPGSFASEIPF